MTPDEARTLLPEHYAQALLLRDCGVALNVIANVLGIEPESMGPLLVLGEEKLARLVDGDGHVGAAGGAQAGTPGRL